MSSDTRQEQLAQDAEQQAPARDLGPSDQELLARVHDADAQAFGELWERHRGAAQSFARMLVPPDDAADVVSEAVLATWSALCSGSGPTQEFRPYLFRAVRNAAIKSNQRRNKGALPTENIEELETVHHDDRSVSDDGVVVQAFQSLPSRWQAVLWYVDVDCESARTVAQILGTTENSVYITTRRAREGLRAAYLTAHAAAATDPACHWVSNKLGSYARGGLTERQTLKVRRHLESCAQCTDAWLSISHLNTRLPVVLPLAIGGMAATWVQVALVAGTGATVGGGTVLGGLWATAAGKAAVTATAVATLAGAGWGVSALLPEAQDEVQPTAAITASAPPSPQPTFDSITPDPAPTTAPAPVAPAPAPTFDPVTPSPTVPQPTQEPTTQAPTHRPSVAPVVPPPTQAPVQPTVAPTPPAPSTKPPVRTMPAVPLMQVKATPDTTNGVWSIDISQIPAGSTLTVSDSATGRDVQVQVPGTQTRVRIGDLSMGATYVYVEASQGGTLVAAGSVEASR